jgi:hypothetical protein
LKRCLLDCRDEKREEKTSSCKQLQVAEEYSGRKMDLRTIKAHVKYKVGSNKKALF